MRIASWLVRPDELRRGWRYGERTQVLIRGQTVRFNQDDVLDELSVDEKQQSGKSTVI
ncbi:MAG: hypothetical protein WD018_06380 [Nitrosopumilaceae archaeon]